MRIKAAFTLFLLASLAVVSFGFQGVPWSIKRRASTVRVDNTGQIRVEPRPGKGVTFTGPMVYGGTTYSGTSSFQPVEVDLNLAAAAGSTDGKFLSPMMGNIFGTNLSKGTRASELQQGGVAGIVMDGATNSDAPVVSILDGSDPSSVTRANAAFAARVNNNNASSGFDYGLDLYDPGRSSQLYTGGGEPLKIAKADIRLPNEVCIVQGAGAPTDGTEGTGAGVAGPGSLYIDTTNAKLYINTNTKASPTWTVVGTQT